MPSSAVISTNLPATSITRPSLSITFIPPMRTNGAPLAKLIPFSSVIRSDKRLNPHSLGCSRKAGSAGIPEGLVEPRLVGGDIFNPIEIGDCHLGSADFADGLQP